MVDSENESSKSGKVVKITEANRPKLSAENEVFLGKLIKEVEIKYPNPRMRGFTWE